MNGEIHINEVLTEIEEAMIDGRQNVFSIGFVRDNDGRGGKKGSIKFVQRAVKGTRTSKAAPKIPVDQQKPVKKTWRYKDHNAIPLQDLDANRPCTPKFTHIITYNGLKVRHYGS